MASTDSRGPGRSFTSVLVRFAEKTSMQGVPYINGAKLKSAKIMWTFLLMCAVGAMCLHLYHLCSQFFLWPKQTSVEIEFKNLQLPAITICNVNALRNSQLATTANTDALRSLVAAVDPANLDPKATGQAVAASQQGRRRKRYTDSLKALNLTSGDTTSGHVVKAIENTFKKLYMEQPRSSRTAMGHSITDMLVSCSFSGQECFPSHFTLFNTPHFGNCYTIESSEFVSKTSGQTNSLELVLYIENREYLKGITQGHGARIDIHFPGTIPDPHGQGFYVSSGFETDIALQVFEITRIGRPYGFCEEGTAFEQKYKRTYTRKACQILCTQEKMLEVCGCYDQNLQEVFYVAGLTNNKVCNTGPELDCQNSIEKQAASKTLNCNCKNPCSEIRYIKGASTRQWPTPDFSTVLLESICEDPTKMADCEHLVNITDKNELSANFLKLVVYYEDLNFEELTESPQIETAQFASDVGGAIGLWIGLSMLSMFEVVQLMIELCDYGCRKDTTYSRKTDRNQLKRQKNEQRQHSNYIVDVENRFEDVHDIDRFPPSYQEEARAASEHCWSGYSHVSGFTLYTGSHNGRNQRHY